MITFTLAILLFFIILWLCGFFYANDFSLPTRNINKISSRFKTVFIVFPHADDEAISCGGLISALCKKGIQVHWIILTKGEKGNDRALYEEKLKDIRVNESKHAAQVYGIRHLIQKDYPDSNVAEHKETLKEDLKQEIAHLKPDLILTFDLAGLYGHPDHIVTSEVVTELVQKDFSNTKLWYVSFPKKILATMHLPEHMASNPEYKKRGVYPTHRIWVGFAGIVKRVRAMYGYESQKNSIARSFPIPVIPLWFYLSLTPFEYFHEN